MIFTIRVNLGGIEGPRELNFSPDILYGEQTVHKFKIIISFNLIYILDSERSVSYIIIIIIK